MTHREIVDAMDEADRPCVVLVVNDSDPDGQAVEIFSNIGDADARALLQEALDGMRGPMH